MASMGASMKHLEAQAKATQQVIAHNSAVIESFKIELATAVEAVGEPVTYVHDIERDEDRLLKRITSTPQKR